MSGSTINWRKKEWAREPGVPPAKSWRFSQEKTHWKLEAQTKTGGAWEVVGEIEEQGDPERVLGWISAHVKGAE